MKKKPPYYLKMYKEWLKEDHLPGLGLCGSLGSPFEDALIKLFEPTDRDFSEIIRYGGDTTFWGFGSSTKEFTTFEILYTFTPLRQTIVLFLAAINGEL